MNILVSSNDKYLKPMVVMLYSLAKNTTESSIDVYFLNVSLSTSGKKWLEKKMSKLNQVNLIFIDISSELVAGLKTFAHFSVETYSRLFVADLIPKSVDRILWLDADIVVHNSVDELYNMDIENVSAIACESIKQDDDEIRDNLNLDKDQKYFNAGVILFNMYEIRKRYSTGYFIDYTRKYEEKLKWLDQDVLNGTIGRSARIINYEKYNYMHFSGQKFSKEEKNFLMNDNAVLHYIGAVKPWDFRFQGYTYLIWRKYSIRSGVYSIFVTIKRDILRTLYLIKRKIMK